MKLSGRQWMLFGIAWVLFGIGILILSFFVAATANASANDASLWIGTASILLGPPILVAITSIVLFGASGRIGNSFGLAGIGVGLMLASVMVVARPELMHGPRTITLGSARGSPSEIAETDAAWVDVSPAFVDTTRIGYSTYTSTDSEGRSSTTSRAVAPILTARGEIDPAAIAAERAALFICLDDREDVIVESRGNGTISGRMHRATVLELEAIADAGVTNRSEAPRCVVPGRGASRFWFVVWIAVIVVGATAGAALVTGAASPRRTR